MKEKIDLDLNRLSMPDFGESDTELDALFSDAREGQPALFDDNFTKVVANSLPTKPIRRRKGGISFDLIGAMIGLVLAYFLFDVSRVVSGVLSLVPETLTLSPVHILMALGFVSGMSVFAWWAVENSRA